LSSPKSSRDWKAVGILAIIIVAVLVPIGYFLEQDLATANGPTGPGCSCFSGNPYVPSPVYNGTSMISGTLANMSAVNGTIPKYVQIIKDNNTIIFHASKIDLPVFAYPNYQAGVVTKRPIPSYDCNAPCPSLTQPLLDNMSLSNSFTIYGLIEPSLVIPRNATIHVTFTNMDPTDHHSFVLTTFPPPYPEFIMQNMAVGGEMVSMTPLIPPVNSNNMASVYRYTVILQTTSNQMWYMCMFPDHAMMGMYGNITVS
jgi:rusticyanin